MESEGMVAGTESGAPCRLLPVSVTENSLNFIRLHSDRHYREE